MADAAPETAEATRTVRWGAGMFGLIVAVVGLALSVLHPQIAEALKPPDPPPPKVADVLAEAGDKWVGKMIDRARGRKAEPPKEPLPPAVRPTPWLLYFSIAATSLGLIGALAGTASWIRREDHRLAASAILVGTLAVAWVYVMAGITIATVIILLLLIFGHGAP